MASRRAEAFCGACAQKFAESTADTDLISTANVMILPHSPGRLWSSTFRLSSLALVVFAFLVRIVRKPGESISKWRSLFLVEPSETYNLQGRPFPGAGKI